MELGAEGHVVFDRTGSPLGGDLQRLICACGCREGVDLRAVRSEHDDVHGEVGARQVGSVEIRAAASVGVQRRQRMQAANVVPPSFRLRGAGNEDLQGRVSGIAHHQPAVRQQRDGLGAAEFARASSPPAQRLHVPPGRVEDAHLLGLVVEHVDVVVIVDRDRTDPAEEKLIRPVEFSDRDLRHQGRLPLPDAARKGPHHGRVADRLDDDVLPRSGRGACGSRRPQGRMQRSRSAQEVGFS